MIEPRSLDATVRSRLRQWPHQPPGLVNEIGTWLRGRPDVAGQCFLKVPGSSRLRTLPDGLWLNFGGSVKEPFVDILAIEACSSMPNLLDKRSRFAPSTQSLMAVCPLPWLLMPVTPESPLLRWEATGVLAATPSEPLILPVRGLRVMYGLKPRHYQGFIEHQIPHPHEFFVPMEALTAKNGDQDPALQALFARASVRANFFKTDDRGMTRIFIDADACPVREEVFRVAARTGAEVLVVHNGSRPIRPPAQPGVQMVIVPDGPDIADDWIAERIGPGDVCVTADIPLAKRCLEKGARALGHSGRAWTGDNIGSALAGREVSRYLREIGAGGGGHAAFTQADRSSFITGLDTAIVQARRPRLPSLRPPSPDRPVITPSTPHPASRAMSAGLLTVHGTTRSPASCARASSLWVSSR